jgi:1,4-dihydroxy-2-naphthoyl-CoA hydrolase
LELVVKTEPKLSPKAAALLADRHDLGSLAIKLGIELLELSSERAVARMPVTGNTQPVGLLHGGAHVVLAESLGSMAANVHAHPNGLAVGIELNASHHRSVREGWVTGIATAVKLGTRLVTHEVRMFDDDQNLLSTVRITNLVLPKD